MIGIALAAYEPDPKYFSIQLRSIKEQTLRDWICVITLDSSLANHRADPLLSEFFADARFIWLENEHRLGHKKNFEKAIQETLKYNVAAVACSDQDDLWYPEKLERFYEALRAHAPLSLVHCDMHVLEKESINKEQTVWELEKRGVIHVAPEQLIVRNVVAGCAMLFDAELARRFPIIPEGAEYHDHWYALVASFYGGVHSIREPLYAYRQHGGNVVGVTPFVGVLWIPAGLGFRNIIKKCGIAWRKSVLLASAARDAGLPLSSYHKNLFLTPWFRGFGLGILALIYAWEDPALSRACLKRFIGSLI